MIYLDGMDNGNMTIYSEGNMYLRGVLASKGGVIAIRSQGFNTIIEKGSTYAGNVGAKGGAIFCNNCIKIDISNPKFY